VVVVPVLLRARLEDTESPEDPMAAALTLDEIVAIDVHTHVHASAYEGDHGVDPSMEKFYEYFGAEMVIPTVDTVAEYYRSRKMMAVTFTVDTETISGKPPVPSNEEIIELAANHRDVLIPFGSVDPHLGRAAVRRVGRLVEMGAKGFKFHPNAQAFYPNDREVYPLYEAIEAAGVPALFHTGHTGVGANQHAGGGIRLKYSNPMYLDDVAVDFPSLTIIAAHPSFPWQDEAISVALHKPNVYIDLSGWSPKYFPENLVRYANTLLRKKVLFGSDYPMITPDKWMADFELVGFKDEVKPLIFKENAMTVLGLRATEGTGPEHVQ
jgi:predicted TIM-barrel fold metal-dependent hydrolase